MTSFSCNFCHRSFNRKEHLTRHILSHTSARPFPCPLCGYAFSRTDALLRHVDLHAVRDSAAGTRLQRTVVACDNCAVRKIRCNGHKPCRACQDLQIDCIFAHHRKRLGQNEQQSSPNRSKAPGLLNATVSEKATETSIIGEETFMESRKDFGLESLGRSGKKPG